jgi:hypothetical protein
VANVAESAVTIQTRFWVESRSKWWKVKSELTHQIFDALQAQGIDIPYPVRTLRVDSASSAELAGKPAQQIRQSFQMPEPATPAAPVATTVSTPNESGTKTPEPVGAGSAAIGAAFKTMPQEEA